MRTSGLGPDLSLSLSLSLRPNPVCVPYLHSVQLRRHRAIRVQHRRRATADVHGRAALLRLTAASAPRPPAATTRASHHLLRLTRVPATPRLTRQPHLPAPRLLRHLDSRYHRRRLSLHRLRASCRNPHTESGSVNGRASQVEWRTPCGLLVAGRAGTVPTGPRCALLHELGGCGNNAFVRGRGVCAYPGQVCTCG